MSSKGAAGRATAEMFIAVLDFLRQHPRSSREAITNAFPHGAKQLWYLEQRGNVKRFGIHYELTQSGKQRLAEEYIWNLSIPVPKRWDHAWHLVLYDIPAHRARERDLFRLRLKAMGLVLYQGSVWIHPYPLEDIIRSISDFYLISKYVSCLTATQISGEHRLRKNFHL